MDHSSQEFFRICTAYFVACETQTTVRTWETADGINCMFTVLGTRNEALYLECLPIHIYSRFLPIHVTNYLFNLYWEMNGDRICRDHD